MTKFFANLGFTRDDAVWGRLQIVSLAGLISSNVFDVQYWATYLGIHLSTMALHWIFALTALVLWIAGKNDSSNLPGKPDASTASAYTIGRPLAALFVVLAAASFAGCGTHAAPVVAPSPTVAGAQTALQVVKALDVVRDTATALNATVPQIISNADLQIVITFHEAAVKIIDAVPGGWKPTVLAAIAQLQTDLPSATYQRIALYVEAAKTLIATLAPDTLTPTPAASARIAVDVVEDHAWLRTLAGAR